MLKPNAGYSILQRWHPYAHETVRSYLDLFYWSFNRFGRLLEIYVDNASFFRKDDGTLTQLGKRLKFLDISFVFANSPEAKGAVSLPRGGEKCVNSSWPFRLISTQEK